MNTSKLNFYKADTVSIVSVYKNILHVLMWYKLWITTKIFEWVLKSVSVWADEPKNKIPYCKTGCTKSKKLFIKLPNSHYLLHFQLQSRLNSVSSLNRLCVYPILFFGLYKCLKLSHFTYLQLYVRFSYQIDRL